MHCSHCFCFFPAFFSWTNLRISNCWHIHGICQQNLGKGEVWYTERRTVWNLNDCLSSSSSSLPSSSLSSFIGRCRRRRRRVLLIWFDVSLKHQSQLSICKSPEQVSTFISKAELKPCELLLKIVRSNDGITSYFNIWNIAGRPNKSMLVEKGTTSPPSPKKTKNKNM